MVRLLLFSPGQPAGTPGPTLQYALDAEEFQEVAMSALCLLMTLVPGAEKVDRKVLAGDARAVLAAVVKARRDNEKKPAASRIKGDALTELYLRTAAGAARKLPAARQGRAFLVGIGIALDRSALMRAMPITGRLWKEVEPVK